MVLEPVVLEPVVVQEPPGTVSIVRSLPHAPRPSRQALRSNVLESGEYYLIRLGRTEANPATPRFGPAGTAAPP